MKHPYILYFIAGQLHTFVREYPSGATDRPVIYTRLKDFSDEPLGEAVAAYTASPEWPGRCTPLSAMAPPEQTGSASPGSAPAGWAESGLSRGAPVFLAVEDDVVYARLSCAGAGYLVGPVRFREPVFFSHTVSCRDLDIPEAALRPEFLSAIPVTTLSFFGDLILLLYNAERSGDETVPFLSRRMLFAANFVEYESRQAIQKDMAEHLLVRLDDQLPHNPYNQEIREKNAIREGDIRGLEEALKEDFTGRYGVLSSDPLRQEIDMGIVTTTLAVRAAIEGGLHQEQAFYISDMTIRQLEAARDPMTAKHIYREAEYTLAQLVHNLKSRKPEADPAYLSEENRHIAHCKDYIFTHLHEKLTVAQVAQAVSLDRSYLSRLFSLHEHMSIKQFITKAKIDLAKNMLTYSSYPYSRIAAYLGFSSQSHLGAEFKQETGMTLKAFRDKYAKDDFIHDQLFQADSIQ